MNLMNIFRKPTKETQQQKILRMLNERGRKGIGSYERVNLAMLQMPVRIMELRRKGFNILSEPVAHSQEVTYILVD